MVQLQDGSKKSFAEISGLPKDEKEKIINGMIDDEYKLFKQWIKSQKDVANQKVEMTNATLIAKKNIRKEVDTELINED